MALGRAYDRVGDVHRALESGALQHGVMGFFHSECSSHRSVTFLMKWITGAEGADSIIEIASFGPSMVPKAF